MNDNTTLAEDLRRFEERRQDREARRRLWVGRAVFIGYWWLVSLSIIPLALSSPRDVLPKVLGWGFTIPAIAVGLVWACKRFQQWLNESGY